MCKGHIYCVAVVLFCLISPCFGDTVYFLVAETNSVHGDSYVLPLTDPNDIAHARDLITYGPSIGKPVVFATVACGSDCINRDYLGANKPAWYWHIAGFIDFNDPPMGGYQTPMAVNWNCFDGLSIACNAYTVVYELGTDPKHWNRDFDGDDDVDFNDYVPLGNNWDSDCVSPDWCGGTDLDHNGKVDCNDLKIFAEAWLSPYANMPLSGSPIEFPCWSWPYQCYGDADNKTETAAQYRVYSSDYSLMMTLWKKTDTGAGECGWPCQYPNARYNPCLDFNRDYKVYDDDLAILTANYGKKTTLLGPPCQPKWICPVP